MKLAWKALFYGMCINAGILMISSILGISPTMTPFNPDQIEDSFNATGIVEAWDWGGTGGLVGDIQSALNFFWNASAVLIGGFIIVLGNMGCPDSILIPVKAVWAMVWFTFVIEFISGRNITGE